MDRLSDECQMHTKGDGSWWEYDGYGIVLCRVCDLCYDARMATYRHDIQSRYECDEAIDDD